MNMKKLYADEELDNVLEIFGRVKELEKPVQVRVTSSCITKIETVYVCSNTHVETTNQVLKVCNTCGESVEDTGWFEYNP